MKEKILIFKTRNKRNSKLKELTDVTSQFERKTKQINKKKIPDVNSISKCETKGNILSYVCKVECFYLLIYIEFSGLFNKWNHNSILTQGFSARVNP